MVFGDRHYADRDREYSRESVVLSSERLVDAFCFGVVLCSAVVCSVCVCTFSARWCICVQGITALLVANNFEIVFVHVARCHKFKFGRCIKQGTTLRGLVECQRSVCRQFVV